MFCLVPPLAVVLVVLGGCGWCFLGRTWPSGALASQVSGGSIAQGHGGSRVHQILGQQALLTLDCSPSSVQAGCQLTPVTL